jgi:hypothetical protein
MIVGKSVKRIKMPDSMDLTIRQVLYSCPLWQSPVDFQVAFLPEIRGPMNVKCPMKNAKWWCYLFLI